MLDQLDMLGWPRDSLGFAALGEGAVPLVRRAHPNDPEIIPGNRARDRSPLKQLPIRCTY